MQYAAVMELREQNRTSAWSPSNKIGKLWLGSNVCGHDKPSNFIYRKGTPFRNFRF